MSNSSKRRKMTPRLQAEGLETRELLTAGAGNNFAILQSSIDKANTVATVPFTINPQLFTRPNGKITIGIDVAQKSGSTVKPLIFRVADAAGHTIPIQHGYYGPKIQRTHIINGNMTTSVLVTLQVPKSQIGKAQNYTVQIKGENKSTGGFLVGFYLPGDVNGTGKVDATSIQAVQAALNSTVGSTKYSFTADANRDGVINRQDLVIAQRNLGVGTIVTPVSSANLTTATLVGDPTQRTTNLNTVNFTGQTTPNAAVTYANESNNMQSTTTTADAAGNYTINVPLVPGSNTMQVTTSDGFGQTISGSIQPVTYVKA